MTRKCRYCGADFEIKSEKSEKLYCSDKCKRLYRYYFLGSYVTLVCDNCEKSFQRKKNEIHKNTKHCFCSSECMQEFYHKETYETRYCKMCNKPFECRKTSKLKFCSTKCNGDWQSENLVGKKASHYNKNISDDDRYINCEWCGSKFKVKPYEIDNRRFCSEQCRKEWFAKEYSQTADHKLIMRKNGVKSTNNSNRNTLIQQKINNILKDLCTKYKNEKIMDFYSLDNYLLDYNLAIEVMGGYWHCDVRKYPNIINQMQFDNIHRDKSKHTFIKKKYGFEILYLWEDDINNNLELCKLLIEKYIKTKGILLDYNSFNYNIDGNKLMINNKLIKPYINYTIEELNIHKNFEHIKKQRKRDESKFATFKCDYCGQEKTIHTCEYIKTKHHYCSQECYHNSKKQSPPAQQII